MPGKSSGIDEWIKRYLKEEEPRSKSLIVSVFGDSIAPCSSGVWLGSLIELMAPLGVNERLVRTSAFRLVEENWLRARREGRRSWYALTAAGIRRFDAAYSRIYIPPPRDWDGTWTMVLLPRNGESGPERVELRRELEWEGYASPTPGVSVHPAASHKVLSRILEDLKLTERTMVLRAKSIEGFVQAPVSALIAQLWDLSDVGERYEKFIARFRPLSGKLGAPGISSQQAFLVQTLLIHSFRRATLHDPRLPIAMLPPDWPGLPAYLLCREIYRSTYRRAQSHMSAIAGIETTAQTNSKLSMRVEQRFGGLDAQ